MSGNPQSGFRHRAVSHIWQRRGRAVALAFTDALEDASVGSASNRKSFSALCARTGSSRPALPVSWTFPYLISSVERETEIRVWHVLHGTRDIPAWMRAAGRGVTRWACRCRPQVAEAAAPVGAVAAWYKPRRRVGIVWIRFWKFPAVQVEYLKPLHILRARSLLEPRLSATAFYVCATLESPAAHAGPRHFRNPAAARASCSPTGYHRL